MFTIDQAIGSELAAKLPKQTSCCDATEPLLIR